MSGWNPLIGGNPPAVQQTPPYGVVDPTGATDVIGAVKGAVNTSVLPAKGTPLTLAVVLAASAAIIVAIHAAGLRSHFTIAAG